MQYRTFGRTGWSVSEVGYGMWGMGGWTGSDDDESMQSLQRAVELGCNFFDTAWAYGAGHSEKLLGQLVRAYSDRRLYRALSGRHGGATRWTTTIRPITSGNTPRRVCKIWAWTVLT